MAYTGYAMLTGDKLNMFYEYVEKKLGRPVWTHDLADPRITEELQKAAKADFVALCMDQEEK